MLAQLPQIIEQTQQSLPNELYVATIVDFFILGKSVTPIRFQFELLLSFWPLISLTLHFTASASPGNMNNTNIINAMISLVFTRLLIHWCVDDMCHTKKFFTRFWRNDTHLLGAKSGKEIRDGVDWGILPQELCVEVGKRLVSRTDILRFRSVCKKWRSSLPSPTRFPLRMPFFLDKEIRDEVAWGNLPHDLCWEIGKLLASRIAILRFRSVCEQWRSSLPPPTRFPLRVPQLPNCDPDCQNLSCLISEVNMYSLREGSSILFGFEEVDRDCKFRGCYLSPIDWKFGFALMSLVTGQSLSQASWVCKAYHLRTALPRSFDQRTRFKGQWDFQKKELTRKIVIISENLDCVNPSYARLSDLMVVAHMSSGEMDGRLALLRLGGSPENWVWETDFCSTVFEDIATCKRQLCMLDHFGRVFIMDYNSLHITEVCHSLSIARDLVQKHLSEAFGELYVAGAPVEKPDGFEVYKCSFLLKKLIKVEERKEKIGVGKAILPFSAMKKMSRIILVSGLTHSGGQVNIE